MTQIILATINARFIHAAVGLRYLYANMEEMLPHTRIMEFENAQRARDIAEAILTEEPAIVGFGVYIWNAQRTREVVSILKKVRPSIVIVLGGPEVSYEWEGEPLIELTDYLITGEADKAFPELCRQISDGHRPPEKVLHGGLPALDTVKLPYRYYTDEDIRNRVIYVEVSRGCPFSCEFCLSSLDIPVRQFDYGSVLVELDLLFQRGARTFKFIDRTFNLNVRTSTAILNFFLDRMAPGVFVHFEMVPDRFPQSLREVIAKFPPGSLQLEIGVQTLNPAVSDRISRRQDVAKLCDNLSFLRESTTAHLHVDLIVGLPGEDLASFGEGFDRIVALDPHEIQVGILKRLKGTPIVRHTDEFQMAYNDQPPYEVVSTRDVSFRDLQRMERFARYFDLVSNSGNFRRSRSLIWKDSASPFHAFLAFSDWLFVRVGRRDSIQLKTLADLLFEFLVTERRQDSNLVGPLVAEDYQRAGRTDLPRSLVAFSNRTQQIPEGHRATLKRQQRFIAD